MTISYQMNIAASPATVFGLIGNPGQRRLWMAGLADTLYTQKPGGDSLLGARCIVTIVKFGRVVEYEGEITGHTPPSHFGMALKNRHHAYQLDYHLSESGPGTRLEHTVQFLPRSLLGRLGGGIFGWLGKRQIAGQLASLKLHAEAMAKSGLE